MKLTYIDGLVDIGQKLKEFHMLSRAPGPGNPWTFTGVCAGAKVILVVARGGRAVLIEPNDEGDTIGAQDHVVVSFEKSVRLGDANDTHSNK